MPVNLDHMIAEACGYPLRSAKYVYEPFPVLTVSHAYFPPSDFISLIKTVSTIADLGLELIAAKGMQIIRKEC